MAFKFNSFLLRASSSIVFRRRQPHDGAIRVLPVATSVADRPSFEVIHNRSLFSESENEKIYVRLRNPRYYGGGPDLVTPMEVHINRGEHQNLYFNILAKPDHFRVSEITIRNRDCEHLENFEEYLRSKGINFGMINMLFDHLGNQGKE